MSKCIWEQEGTAAAQFWKTGKMDYPVYDMHGHMGPHYAIYMNRCEPASMAAHLRKANVKHLVFSHHQVLMDGTMRNQQVYEICKQFPDLFRFYVGIVPRYQDNIKEDLALYDKWAPYVVGLKFLAGYYGIPVAAKEYEYALSFANERGIPVLNHTWGKNDGPQMLEMAQKYTHAKFFMGHSIYGAWDYSRRVVKETPGNVWLELTAIPGERGRVESLVEAVGSDRILFGTDMPWFDEFQAIGGILGANITEQDKKNILHDNADRILGKDW